jgi:hypothetical protein
MLQPRNSTRWWLRCSGTYRIVEVKTLDATGPSHIQHHHTDTTRLGAHLAAEARSRRQEYRLAGDDATELPRGMRLSFFVVSTSGSLHGPSHSLLRDVARRSGRHLPASLLPVATWAAPAFAPFARMAVGLAVRRGLAEYVRSYWRPLADEPDGAPAPPPRPVPRAPGPAVHGVLALAGAAPAPAPGAAAPVADVAAALFAE